MRSCALYAVGIVCAHLLIIGIGLFVANVFETLVHNKLKKAITLTEGSRVFDSWKSPPPPVYMQYFFFNCTNVDDVMVGLAKPSLQQVGPYTYREYRPKANVTMVQNGTRVSAYNPKTFVFERERSVGDPTVDAITTVNIPHWAVMDKIKGTWKTYLFSAVVKPFMTRTVDELLWGYKDSLLVTVSIADRSVEHKFGLMYKKNGTNDGEFIYHTGEENYMNYGKVESWRGESKLSFWTSEHSNTINGTDGSAFHPFLSKEERLYIFTSDLCRTIYMEFEKEVVVKGIPAWRFTPPRSVLASKEENPDNEGYCIKPTLCLGSGLLRVSPCRKGAPVVASFPHFYLGDKKYVDAIDGLSPKREHHQTYLDLNPTTGVPVRANKRAQINILIGKMAGFSVTYGINTTVFPVMFINESVVIDDASVQRLQRLLFMVALASNFPLIIVGLGAILLVVFIVLLVRARTQGVWKTSEVKRMVFTKAVYTAPTTTKEETSYSPVSGKENGEKDDNGTYIGLTPTTTPQDS